MYNFGIDKLSSLIGKFRVILVLCWFSMVLVVQESNCIFSAAHHVEIRIMIKSVDLYKIYSFYLKDFLV
jgi:hypothetical protein